MKSIPWLLRRRLAGRRSISESDWPVCAEPSSASIPSRSSLSGAEDSLELSSDCELGLKMVVNGIMKG